MRKSNKYLSNNWFTQKFDKFNNKNSLLYKFKYNF